MKPQGHQIVLLAICSCLMGEKCMAVTFDTSLLAGKSAESDLSRFNPDLDMPAGQQEMDIYVNDEWKGRYSLRFGTAKEDIHLGRSDAVLLGIRLPETAAAGGDTFTLRALVQGGRYEIDASTLSVRMSVPQAHVIHSEAGYVAPQFWDSGVSALQLSYNTTYYQTRQKSGAHDTDDDLYTGLESGVNLFGWQLRDSSSFRKHSGQKAEWQNNTRYFRRPLAAIRSNLTIGDMYSPGELFDSLRIRAVALASDMNMRPNSQQGFSPIVHGVADSNSLVKVLQNGNVIYQENVPPGKFTLDSIQPTGSAGDLLVIITGADGKARSFTVPFSAVPNMLKQGVSKYSLLAGQVRETGTGYQPHFLQGTLTYGVNNLLTGYAGTLLSEDYRAWLLGSGWNFPVGAVSLDVTQAQTRLQNHNASGQSLRVAYSKFIDATATNFTLAAYRYSTRGYYSFSDAIYSHDSASRYRRYQQAFRSDGDDELPALDLNTWDSLRSARPKNTFTLNLNQRLDDSRGTLFISGTQRDYWTKSQTSREFQIGYSNAFRQINYSLTASRTHSRSSNSDTRFYLSLSIPLKIFDHSAWLTAGISANDARYQQANMTLSGNAMDANRLSYSLSGSNQRQGQNMASASVSYRANASTLGGSWSESRDYRQGGLSARGSLVAVPWHVLAANEMGTTLTIVEAPKAKGLMVNGDSSIVTNSDGLALVPYATPYRKNTITLANSDNASGAEVIGNVANSVPFDGAISVVHFETDSRQSWVMRATLPDRSGLPFGAEVQDEAGHSLGYVGQAGTLFIKADRPPERLIVRLRDGECLIAHPSLTLDSQANICRWRKSHE